MNTLKRLSALVARRAGSLVLLACAISTPADFSRRSYALAQSVATDGTLSTNVTISTDRKDFTVTAGRTSGTNLFHSFKEFSVPAGGSATFTNPTNILNIIGRVTGGTASSIDGSINANGSANLFLLNPSGIIFGPGAALNIGGSFVGSTAQSLQFADGTEFVATHPAASPLLTMSTPVGLQFGQNSSSIKVTGAGYSATRLPSLVMSITSASTLQVGPEKTLALLGNGLFLDGARLSTQAGQVELGSISSGQVQFSANGTFDYQSVDSFDDIQLSNSIVDAVSPGGGSVQLVGNNIFLQDESRVFLQNLGGQPSGSIVVDAAEAFEIRESKPTRATGSALITESLLGIGSDIDVSASRIVFAGGNGIEAKTFFAPGGNISVNATESIVLSPPASEVRDLGAIDEIATSGIEALGFGSGQGGNITVTTSQLIQQSGGRISSLTQGTGNSGDVTINAQSITVEGIRTSDLATSLISAGTFSAGDAGNLSINTADLVIRDGGRVDSSTLAGGDSGSVVINASKSVTVSGTVTGSVNPSLLIASANLLDDSLRISLGLPSLPSGDSGDLTINTPVLVVSEGAQVTVRNDGEGSGGTLRVNASNIHLSSGAGLTASTRSGGGGNINVQSSGPIVLRDRGVISAEAGSAGDGGNINLKAPVLIALENSDIVANAFEGNGGNIQIAAQNIIGTAFRVQQTAKSDVTASSQLGVSGVVNIMSLDVDPALGIEALPEKVVDVSEQIVASCDRTQGNEFVASGRGGLPLQPARQVAEGHPWRDVRAVVGASFTNRENAPTAKVQQSVEEEDTLVEATAWISNGQGETMLVAAGAEGRLRPEVPAAECFS